MRGINMEIVKLEANEAPKALRLIKISFTPLLNKYSDFNHNPATKCLDHLLDEINYPTSDSYFLKNRGNILGYVRTNKRSIIEYSISDLCIAPVYQGHGYAQFFLKELEKKYQMAKKWSLVTVLEEEKD